MVWVYENDECVAFSIREASPAHCTCAVVLATRHLQRDSFFFFTPHSLSHGLFSELWTWWFLYWIFYQRKTFVLVKYFWIFPTFQYLEFSSSHLTPLTFHFINYLLLSFFRLFCYSRESSVYGLTIILTLCSTPSLQEYIIIVSSHGFVNLNCHWVSFSFSFWGAEEYGYVISL